MPKVQFRVSDEELQLLKRLAGERGVSAWLRSLTGLPEAKRGRPVAKPQGLDALKDPEWVDDEAGRKFVEITTADSDPPREPRKFKCGECGWTTSGPWACQQHPDAPQEPIY